jgi:hypothetical protein
LFLSAGCTSPFSEFQSARLCGKGDVEVTGSYTAISFAGEIFQDHLGAQVGLGVTDELDVRARYERIWVEGGDDYLQVVGFGPKIQLHPDQAALYIPVGFAFGGDVESSKTWEIHPTMLATHSVNPGLEVNFSMKALFSLYREAGFNTRLAVNLGLGIGPENLRYTIRPEVGMLVYTSGGSPFFHLGLGVSASSTDKKRVKTTTKADT